LKNSNRFLDVSPLAGVGTRSLPSVNPSRAQSSANVVSIRQRASVLECVRPPAAVGRAPGCGEAISCGSGKGPCSIRTCSWAMNLRKPGANPRFRRRNSVSLLVVLRPRDWEKVAGGRMRVVREEQTPAERAGVRAGFPFASPTSIPGGDK
jgi:hypothetical protein